jgi:hypothetical protein
MRNHPLLDSFRAFHAVDIAIPLYVDVEMEAAKVTERVSVSQLCSAFVTVVDLLVLFLFPLWSHAFVPYWELLKTQRKKRVGFSMVVAWVDCPVALMHREGHPRPK